MSVKGKDPKPKHFADTSWGSPLRFKGCDHPDSSKRLKTAPHTYIHTYIHTHTHTYIHTEILLTYRQTYIPRCQCWWAYFWTRAAPRTLQRRRLRFTESFTRCSFASARKAPSLLCLRGPCQAERGQQTPGQNGASALLRRARAAKTRADWSKRAARQERAHARK